MQSQSTTRASTRTRRPARADQRRSPRVPADPKQFCVPILGEIEWSYRHGSLVMRGRLRAETDTDYLFFMCPSCGEELHGGAGIALEGMCGSPADLRRPRVLMFRLDCIACGCRDFFKIAIDQQGCYGTGQVGKPGLWSRPGRSRRGHAGPCRHHGRSSQGHGASDK
jgi:hypothetical protein